MKKLAIIALALLSALPAHAESAMCSRLADVIDRRLDELERSSKPVTDRWNVQNNAAGIKGLTPEQMSMWETMQAPVKRAQQAYAEMGCVQP